MHSEEISAQLVLSSKYGPGHPAHDWAIQNLVNDVVAEALKVDYEVDDYGLSIDRYPDEMYGGVVHSVTLVTNAYTDLTRELRRVTLNVMKLNDAMHRPVARRVLLRKVNRRDRMYKQGS